MKNDNKLPKSCKGCVHNRWMDGGRACHYCYDTGKPKNCRAAECTHYSTDKREIYIDDTYITLERLESCGKSIEGRKKKRVSAKKPRLSDEG